MLENLSERVGQLAQAVRDKGLKAEVVLVHESDWGRLSESQQIELGGLPVQISKTARPGSIAVAALKS